MLLALLRPWYRFGKSIQGHKRTPVESAGRDVKAMTDKEIELFVQALILSPPCGFGETERKQVIEWLKSSSPRWLQLPKNQEYPRIFFEYETWISGRQGIRIPATAQVTVLEPSQFIYATGHVDTLEGIKRAEYMPWWRSTWRGMSRYDLSIQTIRTSHSFHEE